MGCSPQRFLAQNRNALAGATLTPSSVKPVSDQIIFVPVARTGSASLAVTGAYTGEEQSQYDVQITDADVSSNRVSKPVLVGVGTGSLENVSVIGAAQNFRVELVDLGIAETPATADFEGVQLVARASGTNGNSVRIHVDRSELAFAAQPFSLLSDLKQGAGGTGNPLTGTAYEWGTGALRADGTIPPTAHRVCFGEDRNNIYLQYKKFNGTADEYFFSPALAHDVPAGTLVYFVTGGRTVTVSSPSNADETYLGMVTVYDFLNAINTTSQILIVSGVVAFDRTPGGQATRELSLRTDAHVEASFGSGTDYSKGFVDTFANDTAGTELVTATCIAVNGKDNPNAHLGAEMFKLHGSLSGDLGIVITGIPFVGGVGGREDWGATIPQRLPDNYNVPRGGFSNPTIRYQPRDKDVEPPPICVRSLALGPNAVNQGITLIWTKRPSGNCLCDAMPFPDLHTACLGIFDTSEGGSMDYSPEAMTRLEDLYDWARDLPNVVTKIEVGKAFNGIPDASTALGSGSEGASISPFQATAGFISTSGSGTATPTMQFLDTSGPVDSMYMDVGLPPDFEETILYYESAIQTIDAVTDTALRAAGFSEWDFALLSWKDDLTGSALTAPRVSTMATRKYRLLVQRALAYAGVKQAGKSDASTISGDGCWQDYGGDYFEVVGSDGGKYKPLFPNHPYYSSKDYNDGKVTKSTHEFALQLNIKCPEGLVYGDEVDLDISNAGYDPTYQIGDALSMQVVAGGDFPLSHGVDGSSVETWNVSGDSGPFPVFLYDRSAPNTYSGGGLTFDIVQGGIPFDLADYFTFGVEGAHYRWRKDGGAWSGDIAVPSGAALLDDGLSIAFATGAVPSFVTSDLYSFKALQPYAVSNVADPTPDKWKWDGADATLTIDCGSIKFFDMASIALHTLPGGATVSIAGDGGAGPPWSENFIVRSGPMLAVFAEVRQAQVLTLTIANATDAGIGWLWIGTAIATTLHAFWTPSRTYSMKRGSGGAYTPTRSLGKATNGDLEWSEGSMSEDDISEILDLCDALKDDNDAPFVFVPNVTRPADAIMARIIDDDISYPDMSEGNRDAMYDRRFSAKLSLAGIPQPATIQ